MSEPEIQLMRKNLVDPKEGTVHRRRNHSPARAPTKTRRRR
jgi:hypothetical protein